MTERDKLHIVAPEPTLDDLREQSAKQGRHISDDARAYIAARDWDAMHIAAHRSKPVFLPDYVRRVWR